jgi:hypothetical protein
MAKSYLRKSGVAARYATTTRNVERMVDDRRIPPPDFYNGRFRCGTVKSSTSMIGAPL